jgi:sarcosine oxidase/L-pipecolate oxidase
MMASSYDVIVLGGGPIGLAAAYNCASRGQSVLLLEQFNFYNQSGSSNDLVRMYRTMYTEDFMADLAFQSLAVWDDLEAAAGEPLRWMTGLLNFGDPNYTSGPEGTLLGPIPNLQRLGLSYSELTAQQIMAKYPLANLPDTFIGLYAPDNGCINVPLLLRTLYGLAAAAGATLVENVQGQQLEVSDNGVTVSFIVDAVMQTASAGSAIIACGAYANRLLAPLGFTLNLDIWEMVYEYYSTDPIAPTIFPSMWFQFLDPTGGDPTQSNLFYGFPTVPWGPPNQARIAVDNAVNVISDPSQRRIVPAANDLTITAQFVANHCVGVDPWPNFAGTCLQANVPDNMYVLDFLPPAFGPGYDRVAIFCAGWGMKLVPVIGQILSQLVLDGQTSYDVSNFAITRPGVLNTSDAPAVVPRKGSEVH